MPAACRSASDAPTTSGPTPAGDSGAAGSMVPGGGVAGGAVSTGAAASSLVGVRPSVDSVWPPPSSVRAVSSSGLCSAAITTRTSDHRQADEDERAPRRRARRRRDVGALEALRHLLVVDHRRRLGDRPDGRAGRQPQLGLVGEAAVEVGPELGTVPGRCDVPQGRGERRASGPPGAAPAGGVVDVVGSDVGGGVLRFAHGAPLTCWSPGRGPDVRPPRTP